MDGKNKQIAKISKDFSSFEIRNEGESDNPINTQIIKGFYAGANIVEKTFNDEKYKQFIMILVDKDNKIEIVFNFNYSLLGLLNSLNTIKNELHDVELRVSLYKNKNGFHVLNLEKFVRETESIAYYQKVLWSKQYDELGLKNVSPEQKKSLLIELILDFANQIINNNPANDTELDDDLDVPF